MEFTQNDWGQCDIINKSKILAKRGWYKIHDIIQTKYQKYPSNTILKRANVLDKVNKLPYGRLLNMPSHDAYSITMHLRTMSLVETNHKHKEYNSNNITNMRVRKKPCRWP